MILTVFLPPAFLTPLLLHLALVITIKDRELCYFAIWQINNVVNV